MMPTIAALDQGDAALSYFQKVGFLGETAFFANADGRVYLLGGRLTAVQLNEGLLVAELVHDGQALITAGEDGKVFQLCADGTSNLLCEKSGWWIDQLACGPSGAIAFGSGKKGVVLNSQLEEKFFESERSIEGLAFAPKGMRLAVARYNGVDLRWINTNAAPQFLEWKGSHIGVAFSPDGNYIVSRMQENALHGWRVSDAKHMRMTGYPTKVKSLSWSPKGKWLASSGAPAAITWPFFGKDGPMGKAPKELGVMGKIMVSEVCCHPKEDVVAIGYEDGTVLAVRIEDGKEALLKRPGKGAISCLNWDNSGKRIAYGSQAGEAGIIDISV